MEEKIKQRYEKKLFLPHWEISEAEQLLSIGMFGAKLKLELEPILFDDGEIAVFSIEKEEKEAHARIRAALLGEDGLLQRYSFEDGRLEGTRTMMGKNGADYIVRIEDWDNVFRQWEDERRTGISRNPFDEGDMLYRLDMRTLEISGYSAYGYIDGKNTDSILVQNLGKSETAEIDMAYVNKYEWFTTKRGAELEQGMLRQ